MAEFCSPAPPSRMQNAEFGRWENSELANSGLKNSGGQHRHQNAKFAGGEATSRFHELWKLMTACKLTDCRIQCCTRTSYVSAGEFELAAQNSGCAPWTIACLKNAWQISKSKSKHYLTWADYHEQLDRILPSTREGEFCVTDFRKQFENAKVKHRILRSPRRQQNSRNVQ